MGVSLLGFFIFYPNLKFIALPMVADITERTENFMPIEFHVIW